MYGVIWVLSLTCGYVAVTRKSLCKELEKELELQIGMKTEMEIAMKLLEKDTHEKQDTLVALRQQLEEVKAINLQMFHKSQVCTGGQGWFCGVSLVWVGCGFMLFFSVEQNCVTGISTRKPWCISAHTKYTELVSINETKV